VLKKIGAFTSFEHTNDSVVSKYGVIILLYSQAKNMTDCKRIHYYYYYYICIIL